MNLYQELLSSKNVLNEWVQKSGQIGRSDYQVMSQRIHRCLSELTRTQMILILACIRIGLTGRGELWDSDQAQGAPASFYTLPCCESPDQILERYARFYAFKSRPSLMDLIGHYMFVTEYFQIGLDLLEQGAAKSYVSSHDGSSHLNERDSVREALLAEDDPAAQTEFPRIVAMDNSDGEYTFFEFREDVFGRIEWLRDRFYDWMYGQRGIHPYRIHHQTYERGKLKEDGWYYIQGSEDLVDWINTYVYGEIVGREMPTCPLSLEQASVRLSF
ncbi:hypothetical protein B9G55_05705 [Saccharibacillus sp. O16]|nr:hypothetical protein B9G55_05705 [Saccharibacillus sp. O16]